MPYQRTYKSIVPIEVGADLAVARWLARESFENKSAADCLEIIEYSERDVLVDEIPPKVIDQLGRPLTDFTWHEFTATAQVNQELFDWFTAECAWRNDQLRDWVAAEKRWKAQQARA